MQEDQVGDLADDVLGVSQRAQPLAHHLRADHLVVVEAHPAARLEPPGGRLADVVQQRRQPQHQVRLARRIGGALQVDRLVQHGQRVPVDVLVLVVLVDLQLHGRHLGQHVVGQPGLHQQLDAAARELAAQQLGQLDLHPLRGDPGDFGGHVGHRFHHPVGGGEAELGDEAGGPQHPQRIVGEGVLRRGRGVQPTVYQVRHSAVQVDERPARQLDGHGVHREIAAHQVAFDGVAEGDVRIAAHAVVGVRTERGDLDRRAVPVRAERAELDPGVPDRLRPAGQQIADLLRTGVGGEVQVRAQPPQQRVPHAAADQVQPVARRGEALGKLLGDRGDLHQLHDGVALRSALPRLQLLGGRYEVVVL